MVNTIIRKYLEEIGKGNVDMLSIIENYIDFKFKKIYKLIYSSELKQHFVVLVEDNEEDDNIYSVRYFYDEIILKDQDYFDEIYEENFNEVLRSMINDNLIVLKF